MEMVWVGGACGRLMGDCDRWGMWEVNWRL